MRLASRRWLFAVLVLAVLGCRATKPDDSPVDTTGVKITVDVVPLIIPADSSSTATVWITVLEDGDPVTDSTKVSMVATSGSIDSCTYTTDGLAVATYRAPKQSGIASIIAQSLGARDTMNITLY